MGLHLKLWLKRQARIRRSIKGTYIHRLLGEKLFGKYLWVHDRRAISGSMALGVFIALTPTIPFQMLLAALGALKLRVNLPLALAACWITNPLTSAPIYLFCWRWGRYLLEESFLISDLFHIYSFEDHGRLGSFLKHSAYLWAGSLTVAAFCAAIAYLAVHLFWTFFQKRWFSRRV